MRMDPRSSNGSAHMHLEVLGRYLFAMSSATSRSGQTTMQPLSVSERRIDVAARGVLEQSVERRLDLVRQRRVGRHEIRRGARVVLGLRHEVDRDERRLGRLVGEHQDLARAREHVDTDVAHDQLLRRGDVGVARTGDLVDARDAARPVRERGDGLRAAHLVYLGKTRLARPPRA